MEYVIRTLVPLLNDSKNKIQRQGIAQALNGEYLSYKIYLNMLEIVDTLDMDILPYCVLLIVAGKISFEIFLNDGNYGNSCAYVSIKSHIF